MKQRALRIIWLIVSAMVVLSMLMFTVSFGY